jgi:hypothetical protein
MDTAHVLEGFAGRTTARCLRMVASAAQRIERARADALPVRQRRRLAFGRAFAAALIAGAPLVAAAQDDASEPTTATATAELRSDPSGLAAMLPSSVFVQAGSAEHVDTVSVGAIWALPWQRDTSFGRLATSIEAGVGEWQTHGQRHRSHPFTQIGFTPSLRVYPDAWHGRWFAEAGIGVNVIAPAYHTDGKRFSTQFNFGDHIGIGREFGAGHQHEIALRIEHFSNAGVDHPNPGENFVQLRWVVRY